MNKNRIAGIFILALLITPIASAITTYEETSSVSRIVGESPTEMLRQMQRDSLDVSHATFFGLSDGQNLQQFHEKEKILENQFGSSYYSSEAALTNVKNKADDFTKNELFVLESYGGSDPLHAKPSQYSDFGKITPSDLKSWQLSFETNNPLLVWDSPYAGSYLPKEDTFVSRLVRDATIVAPTSFNSPQFTKSFICNLWSDKTIGKVFKDARNFHYNGGSSSSGDNLIGLVLQSYALYGNPRQIINMDFSEADKEKIKDYCSNFLENLAPDIDFLGQEGNYSKFRKHVVFEIPSYAIENIGGFSIINAENTFQNLEFGELVLPLAVRTTHFPINTLITNYSLSNVEDFVDLIIEDLPSYELDFVNRTCYEDKANYSIEFENSFTENSQDFIARISPIETINCTEGKFRLYKKFNYSVDYIALSPVLIKSIDAPILKPVNDIVNVSIELLSLTDKVVNGSLAIFDQGNNKIWEEETNTNKTDYNATFTAPGQEGLQTYSVEFLQDNQTLNFDEFSTFVTILELFADIPASLIAEPNIEINFISFVDQSFSLEAKYYLLHGNDVIEEGEFTKTLNKGSNLHTLSFNNLKKEDQSYTLTLELDYLGLDRTISYLLTTNNVPILFAAAQSDFTENELVSINYTVIDYDNDPITANINDSRFNKDNNTFAWQTGYEDSGMYNILITASDGQLNDSQVVSITVNNANTAPQLNDIANATVNEAELVNITVEAIDSENDALVYSINDSRFMQDNNIFTWQTGYNDSSVYDALVTVSDGELSDSKIVTVAVNNANRAPQFIISDIDAKSDLSIDESEIAIILPAFTDPDNENDVANDDNNLSVTINDTRFVFNGSAFEWQTTYEDSGIIEVGLTISDGFLNDKQNVTVTVNNVNRKPTMQPVDNITVIETELVSLSLIGPNSEIVYSDPDNENSVANDDNNLIVALNDTKFIQNESAFNWPTTTEDSGVYNYKATVSDGLLEDSQDFTVAVLNLNRAPELDPMPNITANENSTIKIIADASDLDNENTVSNDDNTLSFAINDSRFLQNNNIFEFDVGFDDSGIIPVKIAVTDGELTDSQEIIVTILNVNRKPFLSLIGNKELNENETLTIKLSASDPDNENSVANDDNALFFKTDSNALPSPFDFNPATGLFEWTPTFDDADNYTLPFNVTDGELMDEGIITITVNNVNRAPRISSIPITSATEEQLYAYNVVGEDDDIGTKTGDSLSYALIEAPEGMAIDPATGLIEWVPTAEQAFATYDITVRVSDIEGEFDLQNFSIFVVDTTAPKITITSTPTGFINIDGIIKFDVFELHDDNPIITITPNTSFSRIDFDKNVSAYIANYTDEGLYNVVITATDQSKNTGTDSSVSFSIDKTPPITKNKHYTEWQTEDITIPLNADDPVSGGVSSGVEETYYTIYEDEVPGPKETLDEGLPVISYEDDDNWIEYWSVDAAGNEEGHIIVKEIKLDKTKPSIYLELYPLLEEYPNNESLPVTAEVKDPIVQGTPSDNLDIIYYLGGIVIDEIIDLNVTLLLGKHNITAYAKDLAGNENSATISFIVFLQLTKDQMYVTPEALQITPGIMTSHILFPDLYNASQIFNMTLDGAPFDHASGNQDNQLNIHFRRCDVANEIALRGEIFDLNFILEGSVYYNGQLVKAKGNDDIKKLVDSNGKPDKKCPLPEITKEINETDQQQTEIDETIDNRPGIQTNETNQIIINETTINEALDDITGTQNNNTNGIIIDGAIGNVTDTLSNETLGNITYIQTNETNQIIINGTFDNIADTLSNKTNETIENIQEGVNKNGSRKEESNGKNTNKGKGK